MAQQALGPGARYRDGGPCSGCSTRTAGPGRRSRRSSGSIIIIFMLGYIPDRAYYFTVGRTVDLGVLAWSPINLCPPTNETLPCPPPVGAVVPWETSPAGARCPQPRTDGAVIQVGTKMLYIGGIGRDDGASRPTFVAPTVGTGNFDKWADGPGAARAARRRQRRVRRRQHLRHRWHRRRRRPDRHGLRPEPGRPDRRARRVADVRTTLELPEARDAAPRAVTPDGLLLVGGRNADGPVDDDLEDACSTTQGELGAWTARRRSSARRPTATAIVIGDYMWLYGGSDANGPVEDGPARRVREAGRGGPARQPRRGQADRVGGQQRRQPAGAADERVRLGRQRRDLRRRRQRRHAARSPRSTGRSRRRPATSPSGSTSPRATCPVRPRGRRRPSSPARTRCSSAARRRAAVVASSVRANIAPQSPFFQLGLVGATVPGLKIEGEIGQQLGYLNAAGVGTVNFIILILVGWAFAHKEQTRALLGRFREPARRPPTARAVAG